MQLYESENRVRTHKLTGDSEELLPCMISRMIYDSARSFPLARSAGAKIEIIEQNACTYLHVEATKSFICEPRIYRRWLSGVQLKSTCLIARTKPNKIQLRDILVAAIRAN